MTESPQYESALQVIQNYFRTVWKIMRAPSLFFREQTGVRGIAGPLTFALVTHWLGSAMSFVWRSALFSNIDSYMNRFLQLAGQSDDINAVSSSAQWTALCSQFAGWFMGVGTVIVDPFTTVLKIFISAFFVYIAARIFVTPGKDGAPTDIDYATPVRILAYANAPMLLSVIPLGGGLIANLFAFSIAVIGVRETYRISGGRATLILLFPLLLILGVFALGAFALVFGVLKTVMS